MKPSEESLINEAEELADILAEIALRLLDESEPLDSEIVELVNNNFWDLI